MTVSLDTGHAQAIVDECAAQQLLRNQAAYVMATASWETNFTMEPVREAYWLSEQWRADNLSYYPWYGRGFVQLTWEENYVRAQNELNLDTMLTDSPDTAMDPEIAKQIIVRGMVDGWFTGKKLSDYITLQRSDFVGARRIINGTDSAADIAALATEWDALLLDIEYGVDEPAPEPKPVMPDMDVSVLIEMWRKGADRINELEARIEDMEAWRKS